MMNDTNNKHQQKTNNTTSPNQTMVLFADGLNHGENTFLHKTGIVMYIAGEPNHKAIILLFYSKLHKSRS
jgi:hypothetical protein